MAPTLLSLQLLPLFSTLFTQVSALPSSKHGFCVRQETSAFSPLGCFTDNEGGVKALSGSATASDDMTIEQCAAFCSRFNVFGVEYGRECYCGNAKSDTSTEVATSDCSFPCAGDPLQKCGAGNRLNLYTNNNPVGPGPATSLPGVTSLGCFVDGAPRVFPYNVLSAVDMTAAKCAAHCIDYDYFGTQWSYECYCGTVAPTQPAPLSECSMPCAGNPNELCGATLRLNAYQYDRTPSPSASSSSPTPSPTSTAQVSTPTIDGFEYKGCYTDNVPQRVLTGTAYAASTMILELCAATCNTGDYSWFGIEYGTECYCGNLLDAASVKVADAECSMNCGGDPTSKCGAGNRLSLYAVPGASVHVPGGNLATVGEFEYASCWADDNVDRVLTAVDWRTDDMTVEKCAERCEDYLFFGMEYGRECYCGDALNGGRQVPEQDCGMLCMGNSAQLCGGPARLNLYTLAYETTSTSSSSVSASTPAPVSSASSTPSSASSVSSASSILSSVSSASSVPAPVSSASLSTPSSSATSGSSIIPSFSSIPSSTTISSTTTTQGPDLTTITTCPSSSTVAGPEQCFESGNLPVYCNTLLSSNWNSRLLTSVLTACRRTLTTYGNANPSIAPCFPSSIAATPANVDVARATASSVYSCLFQTTTTGLLCTWSSACQTNTYTVGVDVIPTPTPSIGVNLIKNPSFEADALNWTLNGATSPNMPQVISSLRAHSGSKALMASFLNFNGILTSTTQVIKGLEPGRPHEVRLWYLHGSTTGTATTWINLNVNPGGFVVPAVDLRVLAPGVWFEMVLRFTPVTTWVEVSVGPQGIVSGNAGSQGGTDQIFVDDVSLVRLS